MKSVNNQDKTIYKGRVFTQGGKRLISLLIDCIQQYAYAVYTQKDGKTEVYCYQHGYLSTMEDIFSEFYQLGFIANPDIVTSEEIKNIYTEVINK